MAGLGVALQLAGGGWERDGVLRERGDEDGRDGERRVVVVVRDLGAGAGLATALRRCAQGSMFILFVFMNRLFMNILFIGLLVYTNE